MCTYTLEVNELRSKAFLSTNGWQKNETAFDVIFILLRSIFVLFKSLTYVNAKKARIQSGRIFHVFRVQSVNKIIWDEETINA